MSDSTLAKILAKGCQSTGLDDVVAREFHARLGMSKMAIVELTAASRTEDEDGQESVSLRISSIEVARTEHAEDTLRQIQRVLWRNRAEADGQAVIEESLQGEQTEGDVLRDARAQLGVDTEDAERLSLCGRVPMVGAQPAARHAPANERSTP